MNNGRGRTTAYGQPILSACAWQYRGWGQRDKDAAQRQSLQLAVSRLVRRDGGDAQYISRRIVGLVGDLC
jgi:hypothetical protein